MSDINERLTYRNQYGVVDLFGAESSILREGLETEREVNALTAALKKLAAYEDAEEQGRLTILPFKCGDSVWMVSANEPMTVKGVTATVCAFDRHGRHEFPLTDWGRFVFPTKEAADEAFEKMAQEMVEAGGV